MPYVDLPSGFWAASVYVRRSGTGRTWCCKVRGRHVEGSVTLPARQTLYIPIAEADGADQAAHWAIYRARKVRVHYQGQNLRQRWKRLKDSGVFSREFVDRLVRDMATRFGERWLTRDERAQLECAQLIDEELRRIELQTAINRDVEPVPDVAAALGLTPESTNSSEALGAPEGVTVIPMTDAPDVCQTLEIAFAQAVGEPPVLQQRADATGEWNTTNDTAYDGFCHCQTCVAREQTSPNLGRCIWHGDGNADRSRWWRVTPAGRRMERA